MIKAGARTMVSDRKGSRLALESRGLLRYPAAAEYIGLAEGTLRNQVDKLGIRSVKIGRARCFRIVDLDDFIERKLCETELKIQRRRRRSRGECLLLERSLDIRPVITCLIAFFRLRLPRAAGSFIFYPVR